MSYQHTGEFLDIKGHTWRPVITVDKAGVDLPINFFAGEPVEIEYKAVEKWDCLQGSACTLRIESDTDGRWLHLYSEEAGAVTLQLYRDGALYWLGTLDPEFYEEPYSRERYYDVTLTFTDTGWLDRVKSTLTGIQSLRTIITTAISATCGGEAVLIDHTSSHVAQNAADSILDRVGVDCDALDDDDGEKPTYKKLLEAVMQPLALRIIQNKGQFVVYDLNAAYTAKDTSPIMLVDWDGDNATLGVDKVYKKVTITFDPHGTDTIIGGSIEPDDLEHTSYWRHWQLFADWLHGTRDNITGFDLHATADKEVNDFRILDGSPARFYKVVPHYSGSQEAALAVCCDHTQDHSLPTSERCRRIPGDTWHPSSLPNTTTQTSIPAVAEIKAKLHPREGGTTNQLRLNLDLLVDTRYNPFEEADADNYKKEYDWSKEHWNIAYIPVKIEFTAPDGTVKHWENKGVRNSTNTYGSRGWVDGAAGPLDCYLAYYDLKDRKKGSALLQWATNNHLIGITDKGLGRIFEKRDKGEYIDMPQGPGEIKVTILGGVTLTDGEEGGCVERDTGGGNRAVTDVYQSVRWLCYRNPKLTVVDQYCNTLDTEDIEYSSTIDPTASDELDINTDYGTVDKGVEGARSAYYRLDDAGLAVGDVASVRRGINNARPEQLLISTIYSQYSARHTTLKGDVTFFPQSWPFLWQEAHQPDKLFIASSQVQYIRQCYTDITLVELSAEDYQYTDNA